MEEKKNVNKLPQIFFFAFLYYKTSVANLLQKRATKLRMYVFRICSRKIFCHLVFELTLKSRSLGETRRDVKKSQH